MSQLGIKWWYRCASCTWVGKAKDKDTEIDECPNCTNPNLIVEIDEKVFNGKRYATKVRSDVEKDDAGAGTPDVENRSKAGFNYPDNGRTHPVFKRN